MSGTPAPALRILIGAESAADAPRALRLLPILAEGEAAMFGGLLVMDQNPQIAPRQIVTASGHVVAAPDATGAKKMVEGESRAFRGMLADTAKAVGAEWSATVEVGSLGDNLAAIANAWDIVVLGHRTMHRRRGNVLILNHTPEAENNVLNVASRMAAALRTDVERVQFPSSENIRSDWLADRLNRLNASVVILDAATAQFDSFEGLTALLTAARCPIVILRAQQFNDARP